jgi:hypothetical protein
MNFGATGDSCKLDAPRGKTLILETAMLHDPAERLQRKGTSEAHQHPLLTTLHKPDSRVASPAGLEPATLCLEGRCSIQLSYGLALYCDSNSLRDILVFTI